MGDQRTDGSAGDADYGRIGAGYGNYRRPEPEFESAIRHALSDAKSVLNLGAGAGSYEPTDREVTAVEPSATMREQRPTHLCSAIAASAESLPFDDASFDAAITTFSVHQWNGLEAGLTEMRRVTRGPVEVEPLSIPLHCTDGFSEAYYGRPEMLLDPGARRANSAWSFLDGATEERFVERLQGDLASGEWDRKYGELREQSHLEGSLVLIVARP